MVCTHILLKSYRTQVVLYLSYINNLSTVRYVLYGSYIRLILVFSLVATCHMLLAYCYIVIILEIGLFRSGFFYHCSLL
jgi:hypothetical protein